MGEDIIKEKKKQERTTISIPKQLTDEARIHLNKDGFSVSHYLRICLKKYIQNKKEGKHNGFI